MKLSPDYIKNLSLKKKIHCIVFACITLLASVSFLSIRLISSSYQKLLYQSIAGSLSYSSKELNNYLDHISGMADMFLADATIQDNLSLLKDTGDPVPRTLASQDLYTALNEYYLNFRNNQIRYMSLYQDQFSTHTYMATVNKLPPEITRSLIHRAKSGKGATVWVTDYSEDYGLFMVKEIRRTKYLQLDSIGILIVNIDMKSLINRSTTTTYGFNEANYLLYDQGTYIYDSAAFTDDPSFCLSSSMPSKYGRLRHNGQDLFYVHGTVTDLQWNYVCTIPYGTIANALTLSRNLCLFMILAASMSSLLLSSRLIDSIIRHFDNLIIKMQNFGDGNTRPLKGGFDYSDRKDELGILHNQFDQMVDQVNQLIRSNYLNEILRKEAQLKALETQINPHFLYNTLESINWRAKALGAKDISSMAESLGTLLRITLDQNTKQFPLFREVELIKCYMIIQQFRYEERLQYEISIPVNLLNYEV